MAPNSKQDDTLFYYEFLIMIEAYNNVGINPGISQNQLIRLDRICGELMEDIFFDLTEHTLVRSVNSFYLYESKPLYISDSKIDSLKFC